MAMADIDRSYEGQLRQYLTRLRTSGEDSFGEAICQGVCDELGFTKAGFSWVDGAVWIPSYIYYPPELEQENRELVQAVDGKPVPLLRAPREADLVRSRRPYILARSAYRRESYRPLIEASNPAEYAAAPILANGRTVAMLHVDRGEEHLTDEVLRLLLVATGMAGQILAARKNQRYLQRQREAMLALMNDALPTVHHGGPTYWAATTSSSGADANGDAPDGSVDPPPTVDLTARELEVFRMLASGATSERIAAELFISPETVKSHVRRIYRKLGLTSRAQAAAEYRRLWPADGRVRQTL